ADVDRDQQALRPALDRAEGRRGPVEIAHSLRHFALGDAKQVGFLTHWFTARNDTSTSGGWLSRRSRERCSAPATGVERDWLTGNWGVGGALALASLTAPAGRRPSRPSPTSPSRCARAWRDRRDSRRRNRRRPRKASSAPRAN